MERSMFHSILLVCLVATLFQHSELTVSADVTPAPALPSKLTCYRCNNGLKVIPKCVKAISKVEKEHDITDSTWQFNVTSDKCKTVSEFFSQFSESTGDWTRRSVKKESSKKRGRRGAPGSKDETAYCAMITTYTAGIETPHVFRDCIEGAPKNIRRNFRNMLDFEDTDFDKLPDSKDSKCWTKKVSEGKGTVKTTVCLCQDNYCNNKEADSGAPKRSIHATLFVILVINTLPAIILQF